MTPLTIWHTAAQTFTGLPQFDLPSDPAARDLYISRTLRRIRSGLERDAAETVVWWQGSHGVDRAAERRVFREIARRLRVARRVGGELMMAGAKVHVLEAAE